MNIFVTGGCGFIGSNFVLRQINKQKNVILNYDALTYAGNYDNLESIKNHNNYNFIEGDICDSDHLYSSIINFNPDFLINFAAESHVDRSIDSPNSFINTNIVGTANILQSIVKYNNSKQNNHCKLIHISTDEVFGSLGESGFFKENSRYSPNSPYSASKASSDMLVRAWRKTYDLPAIVINCSNNYGPKQFPEKLIPLTIINCINEKPIPLYGDGRNIRDWIYVNDHCDAINLLLTNAKIGHSYNVGGGNEISNRDVVLNICQILDELLPMKGGNSYKSLINYVKDRPGHDFRYAIDSSKIFNELGWKPAVSFKIGLKKTVQWYLENRHWWEKITKSKYSQERLGLID